MTKKKITGMIVLVILMAGALFLWNQRPFNQVLADEFMGEIEPEDLVSMNAMDALSRFEKIKLSATDRQQEQLKTLGNRQDSIGYLANLALGEYETANGGNGISYYQQALTLYDTKEIRYRLAKAVLNQGSLDQARELYVSLLPEENALIGLQNTGLYPKEIADLLMEKGQWNGLLDYQDSKGDEPWANYQEQQARALAELGRYEEALEILEMLLTKGKLDEELSWWYGRSLEAIGDEEGAMAQYSELGEGGAYRLGLLLERRGAVIEAAEAFSSGPQRMSRWKGAKLWDQLGQWERAVALYRELAQTAGSYQEDAAYRAYILMTRNGQAEAESMAALLEGQPAWMARAGREMNWQVKAFSYEKSRTLETIEAFFNNGREDLAAIELAIAEKHSDMATKLALGDWYLAQDNYSEATKWGIRALNQEPAERAYQLAYQKPYEELVLKAAQEFEVDPYLIWAVMREESHYNANAVSWVGAKGLMQIMPATGQDIAHRLELSITEEDFFKPEINIRFGAYYLGRMLAMFEGNMDKALAAYNGGQGNVRKWEKSDLGSNPEDFPTAITFLETQRYITKVANSYHTYKWLYEGDQ